MRWSSLCESCGRSGWTLGSTKTRFLYARILVFVRESMYSRASAKQPVVEQVSAFVAQRRDALLRIKEEIERTEV